MEYYETVIEVMFQAGAGCIDNYEDYAWQVLGEQEKREKVADIR